MDATSPPGQTPLLLQLSNTASNEARRHWLLEQRLTAPRQDGAVEAEAGFAAAAQDERDDAEEAGEFGVVTHAVKRPRPTRPFEAVVSPASAAPMLVNDAQFRPVGAGADAQRRTSLPSAPALLSDASRSLGAGAALFATGKQSDAALLDLTAQVASLQDALSASAEQAKAAAVKCQSLEQEAEEARKQHDADIKARRAALIQLATTCAEYERTERRRRVAQDGFRLGCVALQRIGVTMQEVWEDGPAFWEVADRLRTLTRAREEVELARKQLKKRIAPPGVVKDPASTEYIGQEEYMLSDECFKVRVACLRKEEDGLTRDRERLEREKARHLREVKRIRDEDSSRLNKHAVLSGRYVLQYLLGRGGFSEVYKAYDVDEMRYVACKIHQLVPQWTEEHKRSYVRHAAREYSIMKRVNHESIVRLFDVFEIDDDSFCTVLELCEGDDLDLYLKANGCVAEREARMITAQIFAGLNYLSNSQRRVIHYDLKPGNVLFDGAGRVKITDFGLSKIMEESSGSDGLELTSQGAGTYWYLPPECFQMGTTPKISSKVDVWSAGVIFYQMLYGKRPFGHDQTQESILRDETILRGARSVDFPAKPAVSNEAKAFIRRCLTYNQADRPDVQQAAADPYLSYLKTQQTAAAASGAGASAPRA